MTAHPPGAAPAAENAATADTASTDVALAPFHPLVRTWFKQRFGTPTNAQVQAWPTIARGEHVLLSAPTGSGKTLTAFLYAIDALLTARYEHGSTRVLYVSPLRALNTDIRNNLDEPLAELQAAFAKAGIATPELRACTRSGDTTAGERARLLRKPPEILITTPESLNIMLTSQRGRAALSGVQAVIIDEVHDLIGNRRGVQLMTALERLAYANGEFQRIALSATVAPLPLVARWVGGRRLCKEALADLYEERPVQQIRATDRRRIDLQVVFPAAAVNAAQRGLPVWQPIATFLRESISAHRSSLIFVNSRRLAEQIAHRINAELPEPIAYAHHGSLARELRVAVETRLKAGQLQAIVATSSLEMGIDIGAIDQVVLLQTPFSIASAIQRIGRAGHQVGAVSVGLLVPSHGRDFVLAAAVAAALDQRDIEPVQPLRAPLDMLAQQVLSMCADHAWSLDTMLAVLRCAVPYEALTEVQFNLVIDMLAGRFDSSRVRGLAARVALDRSARTVQALRNGVLALYRGGGSIPNRGYYALRQYDTNAQIGELDEEFVWEAKIGQIFALGARNWRIQRVTHEDVLVEPTLAAPSTPPFWRAEGMNRSHHFAQRIAATLTQFNHLLEQPNGVAALAERLGTTHHFDATASAQLADFLQRQREHSHLPLPDARVLLVEQVLAGPDGYSTPDHDEQLILHTLWGGRVNRPLALVLGAAFKKQFGYAPELHVGDDVIAVQTRGECTPAQLLDLLLHADIEPLLRESLEGSAFFGARFRECAGRALLLVPRRFNRRQPLWVTRQNAKQLYEQLADTPDFPILLETWRTCLIDEFDLPAMHARLADLRDGTLPWRAYRALTPSPFAGDLAFSQISRYMYDDDASARQQPSALDAELLAEFGHSPSADGTWLYGARQMPNIDHEVLADYARRRARLEPGWLPADAVELIDWIRERIALSAQAQLQLQRAVLASHGTAGAAALLASAPALCEVTMLDGRQFLCTRDIAVLWRRASTEPLALHAWLPEALLTTDASTTGSSRIEPAANRTPVVLDATSTDTRDAHALAAELLAFHVPMTATQLCAALPLPIDQALAVHAALLARAAIVAGPALTDDDARLDTFCTPDTLQSLLRMQRARTRAGQRIATLPLQQLPAFMARWQGFGGELDVAAAALSAFRAPAAAWEAELLPARVPDYLAADLDELLRAGELTWRGRGEGQLTLLHPDDQSMLDRDVAEPAPIHMADGNARYDFFQLADQQTAPTAQFSEQFWRAIWRGELASDDFAIIRAGLARQFELPATPAAGEPGNGADVRGGGVAGRRVHAWAVADHRGSARRAARGRARGWPGVFHRVQQVGAQAPAALGHDALQGQTPAQTAMRADAQRSVSAANALAELELAKRTARLLLHRYGVLNRDLYLREALHCSWAQVFRALRLMELAGEVIAAQFLSPLATPQFMSPSAAARLQSASTDASAPDFWCSATDPVSPCGLGDGWPLPLPRRAAGNFLGFVEGELAWVIEARGRRLQIAAEPGDDRLTRKLTLLDDLLQRAGGLGRQLLMQQINGVPAATSPLAAALRSHFAVSSDHHGHLQVRSLTQA